VSLTIQVTGAKGKTPPTVQLSGRLDSDTAVQLEAALEPLLVHLPHALVFDLAGLDYISSDGIGVLLGTRKRIEAAGGKLLLVHLRPHVEKVFRVIQAIPAGGLFRDRAELDVYLESIQKHAKERPRTD
jgi:anti-anti-sigma factor